MVHQGSRFQSVIPRPTASASFEKLFKMQILKTHPRTTESETPGLGPSYPCLWKALQAIQMHAKFENHCRKLSISINLWRLWEIYIRMRIIYLCSLQRHAVMFTLKCTRYLSALVFFVYVCEKIINSWAILMSFNYFLWKTQFSLCLGKLILLPLYSAPLCL